MIKENIQKIKSELGSISLVAVSKSQSVADIKKAVDTGINIVAENKIQEAEKKYSQLKNFFKDNNVKFHFVGHLQTNKVKKAVKMFDLIQTVDSLKLAKEIDKRAKQIDKKQDVLIEVNIGKEPQKYGVLPEEVIEFTDKIKQYESINVKGLLCMPPFNEDPKPYFQEMKKLYDELNLEILSMGMSNDYKIAIEEGSNMIRIGTLIFEGKY